MFPHLTVRGNLTLAEKWGGRKARVALEDVARFFEITPFLDRKPGTLSGGESQRVSLARGVMAADSLLILDEALASLDPPRKARLLEQIAALPTLIDVPVLMITHSPSEALQVSEKAIGLSKGRIAATGDTRSVLASCGFLKETSGNRSRDPFGSPGTRFSGASRCMHFCRFRLPFGSRGVRTFSRNSWDL